MPVEPVQPGGVDARLMSNCPFAGNVDHCWVGFERLGRDAVRVPGTMVVIDGTVVIDTPLQMCRHVRDGRNDRHNAVIEVVQSGVFLEHQVW